MPDELSAPEEKQRRGPRSNQKLKILYLAKILLEYTDTKNDIMLFVNLSAPDVFFFMQVKRRYRTKQSDIFFSRLFYPVPSCIISYVTIK